MWNTTKVNGIAASSDNDDSDGIDDDNEEYVSVFEDIHLSLV